ncbi:MAG: hypothetical protein WCK02_01455 [Bacteroidota bacterium]
MKKLSIIISMFMMTSVVLTSCGKYEEGPGFSVLPKKSRVVNIWKVDKIVSKVGSSTTETAGDGSSYTEFKKDDTFEYTLTSQAGSLTSKGKWNFDSKKENIEMTFDGSGIKTTNKILMLKSNEMWLSSTSGAITNETHYVTK